MSLASLLCGGLKSSCMAGSVLVSRCGLTSAAKPLSANLPVLSAAVRNLHLDSTLQRHSFFNQKTAQDLWRANTSVSSIGRQRGRARGIMRIKNLNRGQKLGFGAARVSWPGLTTDPLSKERKARPIGKLSKDELQKYEDGVEKIRSAFSGRRQRYRQTPLERGWTSAKPQGKKYAHPVSLDPATDYSGFQSVLVEFKMVSHAERTGRVRSLSYLMVTGNGRGLAGFALSKGRTGAGGSYAFQRAVNKAGLRLTQIPLYEGRTVYHDFYSQFGGTRLFVYQRPPGFGVKAQRVIKSACEAIGLRDLEVELEGGRAYNRILKAFFLGLMRQRTHQQLADEKGLHLVEMRAENDFFPRVLASPSDGAVRTKEQIRPDETLDFELVGMEGNLPYIRPPKEFGYKNHPGYQVHLKRTRHLKHHYEQTVQMLADYGRVQSYWTDKFPECRWREEVLEEESKERVREAMAKESDAEQ